MRNRTLLPLEFRPLMQRVARLVEAEAGVSAVKHECASSGRAMRSDFPSIYAGILLAIEGRSTSSLDILRHVRNDGFARALAASVSCNGILKPRAINWTDPRPFDIWTRTPYGLLETEVAVAATTSLLQANPPPPSTSPPVVVDIGTGNGALIVAIINALAARFSLQAVRLILTDHALGMLTSSAARCEREILIPAEITTVHRPLELMTYDECRTLASNAWFVNVAATLHHVPKPTKIRSLAAFQGFGGNCVLTELEGNHDLPDIRSPELAYSVWRFYGPLIRELMASQLSDAEKDLCLNDFLFPEAATILASERRNRINYHATLRQWLAIALEAGWITRQWKTLLMGRDGPRSLSLLLTPRR